MRTIEDAIEMLKKQYEKALTNPFVRDPLAYALYQTWKLFDRRKK